MQWQFTFIAASQTDKDGDDPACHGSVHDVDVGALFRQKTAFKSLNQAEKLNIINNHFRPGEDYAFPKVFMNGCNRSFQRLRGPKIKNFPGEHAPGPPPSPSSNPGSAPVPCLLQCTVLVN